MREIKFKAKSLRGKWVKGYYWKLEDNQYIKTIVNLGNCSSLEDIEIDQYTLSQYTGLTDKNGEEIYENDRVWSDFYEEHGKIRYDENTAMFIVSFDGWCTDFDHICESKLEVVGNIFDEEE